ncbi:MAG TPA: lactonase family protein [Paludibaculum sp.]
MSFTRRSLLLSSALAPLAMGQKKSVLLYIGAYTNQMNKGISVAKFDMATGEISEMTLAAETANPTFLAIHPNSKYLYSIGETGQYKGQKTGFVSAFSIDKASGKLTLLNEVSAKGPGPCHISLDRAGKMAMIANYGGGSVASYQILADGKLSEAVSFFQHEGKSPHAHSTTPTPDGKYAVVCDLGLDEIKTYEMDPAKGSMTFKTSVNLAPGAGPRHFAWHPKLVMGYSINELNSTVTVFAYTGEGRLDEMQTISTLPADYKGPKNSTAEVRVHPSGKWLYGSNRGDDSIAVFAVDKATGKLSWVDRTSTQGQVPRNFFIDPSGRWLLAANQKTNNIIVFEIDQKTGKLLTTGKGMTVGQPVCLRMLV